MSINSGNLVAMLLLCSAYKKIDSTSGIELVQLRKSIVQLSMHTFESSLFNKKAWTSLVEKF